MILKNKKIIFAIVVIILMFAFFFINYLQNQRYISVVTKGVIEGKSFSNVYTITFVPTENKTEKIYLKVLDENVWNLIQTGKVYFVKYSKKNAQMPILDQIQYIP